MKAATRLKINIIIDILLLLAMIAVSAIGLLLKYVLIHGSDRWEKYGDNVDLRYLGLDRHQWGYIHWIVSLVLIGLIVLHLVFHWKQIVCLVNRYLPTKKTRKALVGIFLVVSLVLAVSPFLFPIEIGSPVRGYRNEALPGGGAGAGLTQGDEEVRTRQAEENRLNRDEGSRLKRNREEDGRNRVEGSRRKDYESVRATSQEEQRGIEGQHSGRQSDLDIQGF